MMSDLTKTRSIAYWTSKNPVPYAGQPCFEEETGKLKIGNGHTRWLDLPYVDSPPFILPPVVYAGASGVTSESVAANLPSRLSESSLRSSFATRDRELIALEKTARQGRRGINVAGSEFNANVVVWENSASFAYLASRGHRLIRLPFLWESIQPNASGALASTILAGLHATVDAAGEAGLRVVLDVHNYGSYKGIAYGAANSFTQADFVDLWTRLSKEFRDDISVVGYGLMNEPRNLPAGPAAWLAAQQAALTAIRQLDDSTCVLIGGYGSSTLGGWFTSTFAGQIVPTIVDPAQNFRWEAHHYWDTNGLGTYPNSYAVENAANAVAWGSGDATARRVMDELSKFIGWLKAYGQRGYIGEFGFPSDANTDATSAAAWAALGSQYLSRIESEGDLLWATAWATGSRWSDGYVLNFYDDTNGILSTPRSNAAVLENYKEHGVIGQGNGRPSVPSLPAFTFAPLSAVFPFSPVGTNTANTIGNGTLRAVPFYLPSSLTIAKLGAEVTAAGEAGSTIRLGLYTDSGNGLPASLIADAGTISGTAVGVAEATLAAPVTLGPGWYWLAAVVQGAPTTQPTMRTGTTPVPGFLLSPGTSLPTTNAGIIGYSATGVTGALPSRFPLTSIAGIGTAIRVHLRLA